MRPRFRIITLEANNDPFTLEANNDPFIQFDSQEQVSI